MRPLLALAALLALTACGSGETGDPSAGSSVAVSVVAPRQGRVTRWLTAFGTATPSTNGTATLSVNQPGQIVRLAVTPGALVKAGQSIVTFAVAPSALSGFEAASTTLATALRQRETAAQLLSQQLATRDQLAQADKAVADARAALSALSREGAGRPVQTLRAPFDGIVTAIPVATGDRTQPGAPLATVARQGAIVVTVGVDPAARDQLRPGGAARLARLSGGASLAGHVVRVDGQLNPVTRLVDVDIGFPSGALLTGEALRVEIATGTSSGWIVPHAAVVSSGDRASVFQVVNGHAKAVPVTVAQTGADGDVVGGPLDGRRPIIVDGAYQVEDGGAVRAQR